MIAECLLFIASFQVPINNETEVINNYIMCNEEVPESMQQYANLYLEHFDFENIDIAVRIGWCESRGKSNAYRSDNKDSGVMQFVPWTWNWIAELYDLPYWDEWIVMYKSRPYTEEKTSRNPVGFSFQKVQYIPYYNILFASILAEDVYGKTQWRDWNSSKWCWEDEDKWEKMWKKERT